MQLGGAAANAKLSVTGALSLGGMLTVGLVNNFTPALGDTFDILDGGSVVGTFSKLQLPALNNGPLGWDTSQLYTMGLLTVTNTVLGDFNRDGQATAADIPAMLGALTDLSAYKSTHSLMEDDLVAIGDFNHDGKVTNVDIQLLLDLIAAAGGGSVTAVPEPPSILLQALAIPALFLTVCRQRKCPAIL